MSLRKRVKQLTRQRHSSMVLAEVDDCLLSAYRELSSRSDCTELSSMIERMRAELSDAAKNISRDSSV